jgi:hypothetical protein
VGFGDVVARAKNSCSRDGSAGQQEGTQGMGEDGAAAKSPKLWHSQTASALEQREQQQQPFLLW